jgi:hypothetical protein
MTVMDHEPVTAVAATSGDASVKVVSSLPDDHELLAHVVLEGFPRANGQFVSAGPTVEEAKASRFVIIALCGKAWVPSRNPASYPLCETCAEIVNEFDWLLPPR